MVTTLASNKPHRRLATLQRFPVSILLTLHLGATVALPALVKETQPLGTILAICAIAITTAFYLEMLASRIPRCEHNVRPVRVEAARWVLAIGVVASIVSAFGGQGSYAVQVGLARESAFVSLFTPFTLWAIFGAVLYMWLYREGVIARRRMFLAIGTVVAVHAGAGLYRAILGQAAAAIVTLLVVAVLMGIMRLRALVAIIAALVVIWPVVYDFRDSIRRDISGRDSVVSSEDPMGRLQLDEQMSVVRWFEPGESGVKVPSANTVIRTGLLPRVIDSSRPAMDTGAQMSIALGGSYLNSRSATFFGNVYIFHGPIMVGVVTAGIALAMGVAIRRSKSPWWIIIAGLIYENTISFNATFPNGVAGTLQGIQSLVVAYVFVHLLPRVSGRRVSKSDGIVRFRKLPQPATD